MTQQFEVPEIGTVLVGRSAAEIAAVHPNTSVAKEGQEYKVIAHETVFGQTDLVIEGAHGTFSVAPDMDGHSYLTFFKHKEL